MIKLLMYFNNIVRPLAYILNDKCPLFVFKFFCMRILEQSHRDFDVFRNRPNNNTTIWIFYSRLPAVRLGRLPSASSCPNNHQFIWLPFLRTFNHQLLVGGHELELGCVFSHTLQSLPN